MKFYKIRAKWYDVKYWWIENERKDLIRWKFLDLFICSFKGHSSDEYSGDGCARCLKPGVWEFEADNG